MKVTEIHCLRPCETISHGNVFDEPESDEICSTFPFALYGVELNFLILSKPPNFSMTFSARTCAIVEVVELAVAGVTEEVNELVSAISLSSAAWTGRINSGDIVSQDNRRQDKARF